MARLLGTQQVAGTPDFQIPHGNFEAGAEFRKIPNGRQPFFRNFRQVFVRTVGEIGIGVPGGASYPPPELMQLGQAEPVGIFNNQGIGVWNVQAGFNDGGAYQNLDFALGHGLHDLAQSFLAHLTVSYSHPQAGDPTLEGTGAFVNGFRPIVQIVNLAAPFHLPADGVIQHSGIVLHHKGLHRIPVGRGLLNGGHIPDAGQRHVQCPGNGGCREGQHIHALGHFLQPFLMADTEALLLVNNQKPQILELNAFLQQLVGTDDQINGTGPELLQGLLLQLRSSEPAEHVDVYGETPEPGHGGLIMLLGQHGSGHQDGHLLAVHHCLHHSSKGHLRFSEANVPAQQPIHGGGGFHIPLDVGNAAQLVICFRIGEVFFKLPLPGGVGGKSIAGLAFPGSIELNQFPGHILGGLPGLGFGFLPGVRADLVQLHLSIFSAADVFADQIQLGGRDEQGIAALISNLNIVFHRIVHFNLLHGDKAADAIIFVNHQIPGHQIGEGVQFLTIGGAGFLCGFFLGNIPGKKLAFGENGDFGQGILHAEGQGTVAEQNLTRLGQGAQGNAQEAGKPPLTQHFLHQFRPTTGATQHQGAEFHFLIVGQIGSGGVHVAAVAGKLLGGQREKLLGRALLRVGGAAEGVKIYHGVSGQTFAEILPLEYKIAQLSHQQSTLKQTVQLHAHLFRTAPGGALKAAVITDHNQGIAWNVVGGGGHFRINQGHIPIGGRIGKAIFIFFQIFGQGGNQGIVPVFPAILSGNQIGQIMTKAFDPFGVQTRQRFAHREDGYPVCVLIAALGHWVKITHGIQFIPEEFHADGLVGSGGEHIHNTAPDGELTAALHHPAPAVSRCGQTVNQFGKGIFLPGFQGKGSVQQRGFWNGPQTEGFPAGQKHGRFFHRQIIQLAQPFLLPGSGDNRCII